MIRSSFISRTGSPVLGGAGSGRHARMSNAIPSSRSGGSNRLRARHGIAFDIRARSEEHTSELQSHSDLVCRLLLEKKKKETKEEDNQHICDHNTHMLRQHI